MLNALLVACSAGFAIGAVFTKDKASKYYLFVNAGIWYGASMIENMGSKTFGLLMNQVGQEEAYAKLESYKSIKPRVSCTI